MKTKNQLDKAPKGKTPHNQELRERATSHGLNGNGPADRLLKKSRDTFLKALKSIKQEERTTGAIQREMQKMGFCPPTHDDLQEQLDALSERGELPPMLKEDYRFIADGWDLDGTDLILWGHMLDMSSGKQVGKDSVCIRIEAELCGSTIAEILQDVE